MQLFRGKKAYHGSSGETVEDPVVGCFGVLSDEVLAVVGFSGEVSGDVVAVVGCSVGSVVFRVVEFRYTRLILKHSLFPEILPNSSVV